MKKLLTILAVFLTLGVSAQQSYVSGSYSFYNSPGTFSQKSMGTLEVGRYVHNVATLGIAAGVTSFSGGKAYVEFRPSLIVWSSNQFSLSGTLGAGYIFDSPQSFLSEYTGTASYSFKNNMSVSVFAGGYKFSGKRISSDYTFVGTGLTINIPKSK